MMTNWDTNLIEMLHSCEAGEKAVITGITYNHKVIEDRVHFEGSGILANGLEYWNKKTNLPVFRGKDVD